MKKNNFVPWIVVVVVLLTIGGFLYFKTITGNMVLNDYSTTAYAPPYDVNNSANFIFNVTPDNFTAEGAILNLNVTVNMSGGYVYQKGYVFNFKANKWDVFNFIQTPVENSYWIQNFASSSLLINSSDMFRDGENYVVAYACKKVLGVWKCGCNNLSAANSVIESCANWMLQIVNVSNITNPVVNIPCTSEDNCSSLDVCNLTSGYCVPNVTIVGDYIPVSNCTDLQNINNDLSGNYRLMKDIDCANTVNWNNGQGFMPINSFTGNFNGQNNKISNLLINLPSTNSVGLFGDVWGDVSNVGLININVTGRDNVGGLVGRVFGNISNSYTTGNVIGNSLVGGLFGYQGGGIINNSYSMANVTGDTYVGGLAGYTMFYVYNSYSTGNVAGNTYVGGLIGFNQGTDAINSFWDTETSGQSTSAGGTGLITNQMKNKTVFENAGWDFMNVWNMTTKVDGSGLSDNYPRLKNGNAVGSTVVEFVLIDGLMWQKSQSLADQSWGYGNDYCSDLVVNGYSDWRLPLRSEIANVCSSSEFDGCGAYYWASSGQSDVFSTQFNNWNSNAYGSLSVLARCVRSN